MRALPWHCVACVTSKARQTGARNSGVMGRVLGVAVTQVILHGPEVGAPVRKSKIARSNGNGERGDNARHLPHHAGE